MVRRDDPASVGLALDDARDFSHRFKPPDMRFGEAFAGGRIVETGGPELAEVLESEGYERFADLAKA